MGVRNFLVEGVSGTGKTTVCDELARRGYETVHGDRVLAYRGDPVTGEPLEVGGHENHLWRVDRVQAMINDRTHDATFFCGGSRNHDRFVGLLDGVFVLHVDLATLERRLDQRDPDEWGHRPEERELVRRLHRTQEDIPDGVIIDASRPVTEVVDDILSRCGL